MTGAPVAILQLLGQCGFCRRRRQGQELDAANAEPVESPETLVQAPRERPGPVSQPAGRIVPANDGLAADALVLGRYRLLERLGAGGFGVVWRAHDELLHREVAVKRIWLAAGEGQIDGERASREALATARLSHPAIVALYEACPQDGAFYLISELVDGDTLAQLIELDELADEEILEIGSALASALAHAHARGVIHRDIKPQNVLVPASSGEHAPQTPQKLVAAAKLTDFGGASLVGEEALTRTGDVLGTLAYMAPEQSEGREVGVEADLYSLALVLYEALCGFNPVRGATPAATVRRIGQSLPALARARRDLPHELTCALDRALAPAPGERGTLDELRDVLEHTLEYGLRRSRWRRAAPLTRRAEPRDTPPRILPRSEGATELDPRLAEPEDAAPAPHAIWLPRGVWFATAGALVCWQAVLGRPGVALLLLAALLPPLLIGAARPDSRLGVGWLAAALAPMLGVVGLAGAFPAIAGQASCWRMRAALGALGYWWLTLAGPLLGRQLWLAAPHGTPRHAAWEGSIGLAATHVLAPVLAVGVLFGALLWGVAAAVLPLIVRGCSAVRDVVAVALWSAVIVVATPMLDAGLSAHAAHPSPRGALLGAGLGAFVAVAARAVRGPV
jgi:serine/threonine protein kinase